MPTQPDIELTEIELQNATQSSDWGVWRGYLLEASVALDKDVTTIAHTKGGRGHWWKAEFTDGTKSVTEVRVTNRQDCCGNRLKLATVWVGDVQCGTLPDSTANGVVYTVPCIDGDSNPIELKGNSVTIKHDATYNPLQLAVVEVFGNDNCKHDERLNALGAHKCASASDCSGARTCSRWGWCAGESECSGVVDQDIRAMYVTSLYKEGASCT
jgi:hypothetical protein